MEISSLGEFGLIHRLTDDLKPLNSGTLKGVGDDCAVLHPSADRETLVTTDLLMEGIHFDLQYTPLMHLGYKAVVVNLSDIYAMNGTPRQITVSLAIGKRFTVEDIEQLYSGMRLACENYNVDIVGGDTTSSLTGLAISITAIGEAPAEDIVYRNGARDTDLICVTGNLGAAYMGLQLLEREKEVYNEQYKDYVQSASKAQNNRNLGSSDPRSAGPQGTDTLEFSPDFSGHEYILERQLRPEPRADVIADLRQARLRPTAMIDISDGLSSELLHICSESHCGCRIYEERIPLDYQTASMAEELNLNVTTCALNGGEDYELLFTVPLTENERIAQIRDVKIIGHITREALGKVLVTRSGQELPLQAQGWDFTAPHP